MSRILVCATFSLLILGATPATAQYGGSPDQQIDPPARHVGPEAGKGDGQAADVGPDVYDKDRMDEQAGPPAPDGEGDAPMACRPSDGTTGAIVGGGAGALVGRGIDRHGERGTGTIIGAVLGALIGHAVAQGSACR